MFIATFGKILPLGEGNVSSSVTLIVEKEGTGYRITSTLSGNELVIGESDFKAQTKYIIQESPIKGLVLIEHDSLFKSKEQWAYRKSTEVLGDPIANIYFHTDWESSVLFFNRGAFSNSVEDGGVTHVDGPAYIHDAIASLYEEGEYVVGHNTNLRMDVFKEVNLIDSIVALEQQVDLLTALLLQQVTGEGASNEYIDKLIAINENNSLNVIGLEKLSTDCKEHKAFIRGKQITYLTERK